MPDNQFKYSLKSNEKQICCEHNFISMPGTKPLNPNVPIPSYYSVCVKCRLVIPEVSNYIKKWYSDWHTQRLLEQTELAKNILIKY